MGLRFRKSFKIAPGVKVNLNKRSTSVTFGGKVFHHTISSTGKRTSSASIPGTGIYYTKTSGKKKTAKRGATPRRTVPKAPKNHRPKNTQKWYTRTGWIIFFLIFLSPLGIYLMWRYKKGWNKISKVSISILCSFWFIILLASAANPEPASPSSQMQDETISTESESLMDTETETSAPETVATEALIIETQVPETTPPLTEAPAPETEAQTEYVEKVWINDTGEKYHRRSDCSGMKNSYQVTKDEAISMGKEACKKCY